MSTKNVSIRLAAVGGKKVKAEFEGIGKSGQRGFRKMSREAEIANAKLAKFARRAKLAAKVMGVAMAAAGVAMVRSGLQAIDAQAKLAASLDTTTASIQVLTRAAELAGVSQGEVEQATIMMTKALSQAAQGTGPAVKALKQLNLSAEDLSKMTVDKKIITIRDAIAKLIPASQQAAVSTQIFGARAGLVFSRIDSATLRQATQDVVDFGVAVSERDAAQIQVTNDALSRMGLLWRGIANQLAVAAAPALQSVADAMANFAKTTGPVGTAIKTLVDNIDRIATITATFAAFMAGRFVIAMGVAAVGILRVAKAADLLRISMGRTGIGLIAVGIGELAYRMSLFSHAADTSSEAQKRLNEAMGIYSRDKGPTARAEVVASAKAFIQEASAKAASLRATLALSKAEFDRTKEELTAGGNVPVSGLSPFARERLLGMMDRLVEMRRQLQSIQKSIKNTVSGLGELETADPAKPITAAATAAGTLTNALVGATAQASALSTFLSGLPGALAGSAAKIAGLKASIATLAGGGDAAAASIAKYRAELVAALPPLESMADGQREFVRNSIEQKVADFAATKALEAEEQKRLATLAKLADVAKGGGGGGPQPPDPAVATGWSAVANSLADYAKNAQSWGDNIGDSFVGAFKSAENAFSNFVKGGKFDFRSLISSMLADLALLEFKQNILGPIAKFLTGAVFAPVNHAGGMVGAGGAPTRAVPALAFAGAPRMHSGGWAGLRPDEVPSILQRGERVLSRQELARAGSGGGATPLALSVNVEGARGNAEIQSMVAAGVEAGLDEFNRNVLPVSVAQINANPRGIG